MQVNVLFLFCLYGPDSILCIILNHQIKFMRKYSLFMSALAVLFFASCKKDSADTGGSANQEMLGNYKFVSLTANTTSIKTINDGSSSEKSITRSTYTTTDNSGTLSFEPTKIISKDLAYTVNTTASSEIYEDGVYVDTYDVPFLFTVTPSSATSEYKWVTKDSLYFTSGSMFYNGSTVNTGGDGAKVRLEGDKLYFTGYKEQNGTSTEMGYQVITNDKASVIAVYQKQ
jgi:hypothetical protein